jgi:protein-disulfide isomerase
MSSQKYRERRADRIRQRRKQRLVSLLLILGGVVLVFAAFLYLPSLLPAGEFTKVEPKAYPVDPDAPLGNALGDPNAPLTLVEFSDFGCSACAWFKENVMGDLIETYIKTGKVYYMWHSVGAMIQGTSSAGKAIEAAYCAGDQGMLFPFQDMMFANQSLQITDKYLVAFAEYLGLDIAAFKQCTSSNKYADQVTQDFNDASQYGVTGTPSFVFNDVLWDTNRQVPDFAMISEQIESYLAALSVTE